jgi:hypothetical protein
MAQGAWGADPTGRHELRYWDGDRWTAHVADHGVQDTDVYLPTPPPPPKTRKKKWPWIVGGISVLAIAGGALIGVNIDHAVKELDAEQRRHAITPAQYDAITFGMSRDNVVAALARTPENTQEFVTKGLLPDTQLQSSCIYYNKRGGQFGDRYQFCFDATGLASKGSY